MYIQEGSSLSQVSRHLTKNDDNIPSYYNWGKSIEQIIIHCSQRLEMSDLNFDFF